MLAAGSVSPGALRRAPSTESYTSIWSGSTAPGRGIQDPVLGPTRGCAWQGVAPHPVACAGQQSRGFADSAAATAGPRRLAIHGHRMDTTPPSMACLIVRADRPSPGSASTRSLPTTTSDAPGVLADLPRRGLVDAPGRGLVGAKVEYPFHPHLSSRRLTSGFVSFYWASAFTPCTSKSRTLSRRLTHRGAVRRSG